MGGICGMIDMTRQGRADPALARRMAAAIRHRGPDGEGFYDSPHVALGVRRLNIIDLRGDSPPFYSEDRAIVLAFAGRVFNYREQRDALKRRNHIFHTDGDGEIIAHLYEDYGLNLFGHLRGMYAFALWDSRAGRLLLAADHAGLKPLYLHQRDGMLYFASEIKALLADPAAPRQLRLEALDTYLSFGSMTGDDTLFQDIHRLTPGCAWVVEPDGSAHLYPFWQFGQPLSAASPAGAAKSPAHTPAREPLLVQQARDLLADSVRLHLRSDAPLGVLLDGGLESAAVLALAAREGGGNLRTFALAGEPLPRQIAAFFKAEHNDIAITAGDWWRALQQTIYHHDEPLANPAAPELLLLAAGASAEARALLTGFGGRVFGGGDAALAGALRRRESWEQAAALLAAPPQPERDGLPLRRAAVGLDDSLRQRLYSPELLDLCRRSQGWQRAFSALVEKSRRGDVHATAQALLLHAGLPGAALLCLDKTTLAASVEARAPFLDPALLKFVAGLPPALRGRGDWWLLRQTAGPLLPDYVPDAPPAAPPLRWLDDDGINARAREALTDPNGFIAGLFDRAALEALLKDHFWGRRPRPALIFRLLALELWGQRFIKPPVFEAEP